MPEGKPPVTRELKPCGTRGAYLRHLAHREVPDEACAAAARGWATGQRRKRRTTQAQIDQDIRELVHVLACALGVGRKL
jgi:hypothetical protein